MRCKSHTSGLRDRAGVPALESKARAVARVPVALQSCRRCHQQVPARSSAQHSVKQARRMAARASLGAVKSAKALPERAGERSQASNVPRALIACEYRSGSLTEYSLCSGWSFLACVINAAFQVPPLYKLLMSTAKKSMIRAAEKNGIAWGATANQLQSNAEVIDKSLQTLPRLQPCDVTMQILLVYASWCCDYCHNNLHASLCKADQTASRLLLSSCRYISCSNS